MVDILARLSARKLIAARCQGSGVHSASAKLQIMKTLQIPEAAFEKLERYRSVKGLSQADALSEALERALQITVWKKDVEDRPEHGLSEVEADALAVEAVRAIRS